MLIDVNILAILLLTQVVVNNITVNEKLFN